MHEMTAQSLRSAYGGESMAHMRYKAWSAKAEKDGFPNVARLFSAISWAEEIHATNHFKAMKDVGGDFAVTAGGGFGLGSTSDNLQGAIDGENFEIQEMYPAYLAVAEAQKEKAAIKSMQWAIEAEKTHSEIYTKAKKAVDGGKDLKEDKVYVCEVCGHTHLADAPDKCPICGVGKKKYREFA